MAESPIKGTEVEGEGEFGNGGRGMLVDSRILEKADCTKNAKAA